MGGVFCQTVQVRGTPSDKSSITRDPMPWPAPLAHACTDDGQVDLPARVKVHRRPS